MKKFLMILLAALLVVALTACGKTPTQTTAPTATTEPTATTAPTPTPSEVPTLVPTAVPNDDKDESKDNENDDGISIAPIVPPEDEDEDNNTSEEEIDFPYINDVKEPSATPVIVPTTVPTVTPSEAPTSTPSPVPTTVPTVAPTVAPSVTPTVAPTATPSPTPTKVPEKVEANGDVIAWSDEVIKLNTLGIEVPVLKEFNKHALSGEAHEYISWNGDVTDSESLNKIHQTLHNTREAAVDKGVVHEHTGQGFLMDNYAITWDYMQYSANSDLELKRSPSDGEYTLILNASLLYDEFDTRDLAPYSRDVLKVMLSVISSTPEELYEYLYTGLYVDGKVLYSDRYVPVGDAGIRLDYDASYVIRGENGEKLPGLPAHVEFKIKPQ